MKNISITNVSTEERRKLASDFFSDLWYAPADVFLRMYEVILWKNITLPESTLDIGCGDGSVSKHIFAHLGKLDVGFDLDPTGAEKSGSYKEIVAGDATNMPFEDGRFEVVTSNSTFEHIPDDIAAVAEVARVLKKGGIFYLTVPTPYLKKTIQNIYKDHTAFTVFNDRVAHEHYRTGS